MRVREILPLRKGKTISEIKAKARSEFALATLRARNRLYVNSRGIPLEYELLGNHYSSLETGSPSFKPHLDAALFHARSSGVKTRWLDIGPGLPENFMPYFEKIDSNAELIELHTLAPEQILPRTKEDNYSKWKKRLTHHVGMLETYNTRKLGEFNIIVSSASAFMHSKYPVENLYKTCELLAPMGSAYIHRGGDKFIYDDVKKLLARKYNGKYEFRTSGNFIVVTRISK